MPTFAQVKKAQDDALKKRIDRTTGVFKVATESPLTVYLNGDETTAVPAVGLLGLTYAVGTKGRYQHDQGQQPLCFPTIAP